MTSTGDGLKLLIERSKMDMQGDGAEIAIPHGQGDDTCPVTALKPWLELSDITAGLQGTLAEPFSPHGLRAGYVTTAHRNGVPDEEIWAYTRRRSLTTMRGYVRRAKLSREIPAGKLGL